MSNSNPKYNLIKFIFTFIIIQAIVFATILTLI